MSLLEELAAQYHIPQVRYDTHKRSDLKKTYNDIVKKNTDSPLYLMRFSDEDKSFAISLKEAIRELGNTMSTFADDGDFMRRKLAFSTENDVLSASYVGEENSGSYEVKVNSLATSKIIETKALNKDEKVGLPQGLYSFDLEINELAYEFQFNITDKDTNKDIQRKIANLVNRGNVGLHSELHEDDKKSYLTIESSRKGENANFEVREDKTTKRKGIIRYLGLDRVAQEATNSEVEINGVKKELTDNHFIIDKTYQVDLKRPSNKVVNIGLRPDIESIQTNLSNYIDGYNKFISSMADIDIPSINSKQLLDSLRRTNMSHLGALSGLGIGIEQNGHLLIDQDSLKNNLLTDDKDEKLSKFKDYTQNMSDTLKEMYISPMEFVNKKVVEYKDFSKPKSTAPYITSMYSGMLFNRIC